MMTRYPHWISYDYFNNSNSATLAKVDDVITFSIRATELIKAPTIVIAGRTGAGAATLSDDTNTDGLQIYTATYTMKQDDPEGVVAFTVDFEDLALMRDPSCCLQLQTLMVE